MFKIVVSQQKCPKCRGTGEVIPEHGTVEGPGIVCKTCGGYKEVILLAALGIYQYRPPTGPKEKESTKSCSRKSCSRKRTPSATQSPIIKRRTPAYANGWRAGTTLSPCKPR
jgi:hypothetical protein